MPLVSDSATCSPVSRQTLARRNRVSPSTHSLLCRSNVRGVEAMVKLATGRAGRGETQPGPLVRLPITVMPVSPVMVPFLCPGFVPACVVFSSGLLRG
jgi:hypothetical protein